MNTQLLQSQHNVSIKKQTRTVSIRLYVSTVVFLGCMMVWMQLTNTNVLTNNNNINNNRIGDLDGPTMYGQSVRAADELLELRSIVEFQGEKMKEQGNQLTKLQKRFDDKKSSFDEKKAPQSQSQSLLVRPLGGGDSQSTSSIVTLTDRLSRLETITKGYMNWITDPFTGSRPIYKCQNETEIAEHYVCFDHFPPITTITLSASASEASSVSFSTNYTTSSSKKKNNKKKNEKKKCIVYDYGIREQPEFGLHFATNYPECEVHAFDPSPTSVNWWNSDLSKLSKDDPDNVLLKLKAMPNYFFHEWGAGGVDGELTLFGYNWGQVSSVRIPYFTSSLCGYGNDKFHRFNESFINDPKNYHEMQCLSSTDIRFKYDAPQHDFAFYNADTKTHDVIDEFHLLEVKTLKTTMEVLGHTHIDVLKMDVEGSEYQFIESAIDAFDCPPVSQMSIEWHHHSFDPRYGGGSSRDMNAIVTYLHDRCNVKTYQGEEDGGYCSTKAFAKDSGLRMCYMTTSLIAVP